MKSKKIFSIQIVMVLLAILISGCSSSEENTLEGEVIVDNPENVDLSLINQAEEICLRNNGNWIKGFNECEGIAKPLCEEYGGMFESCGSACRNDPNAEMCTLQCVMYCDFSRLTITNDNDNGLENYTIEISDNYGNLVPNSCQTWFDGCNTCRVNEEGTMACTKMACENDNLQTAECRAKR